jgi:hypothetical protein
MGLLSLGLVLTVVGVVGWVVAAMAGPDSASLLFTIESGVAVAAGLTCLGIGGLRHAHHRRLLGAPPGDMDMAQAIDPQPAVVAGEAASR